jgi:hypothetical protein
VNSLPGFPNEVEKTQFIINARLDIPNSEVLKMFRETVK